MVTLCRAAAPNTGPPGFSPSSALHRRSYAASQADGSLKRRIRWRSTRHRARGSAFGSPIAVGTRRGEVSWGTAAMVVGAEREPNRRVSAAGVSRDGGHVVVTAHTCSGVATRVPVWTLCDIPGTWAGHAGSPTLQEGPSDPEA